MNYDEAIKVVLTVAAKEALSRTLKRFGKTSNHTVDPALVEERLKHQAQTITLVKTLLSPNTPVPIDQFFCAPSLRKDKKLFTPRSSLDFDDHSLIEGVAGQGKSTLLRYLCSDSVLNHGRIAFYFELRRLDHKRTLVQLLLDELGALGIPQNQESLRTLAASRDVEVYLDGFDELSTKEAQKVDRDIDFVSRNFPLIRLFVSSRPHVELSKNVNLTVYRIEDLDRVGAFKMIDALCPEGSIASSLKSKLQSHTGGALDLLETPLLVTLLVARYRQTQQIPEQLWEFYDSIFEVLFERHDTFKSPYNRPKRLPLTTYAYKKAFEQFCFGTLFAETLTTEQAIKLASWSLRPKNEEKAEQFLLDIEEVSSLIIEEVGIWNFIHNSIQESHAAHYLLSGTDTDTAENAIRLLEVRSVASRSQVVRFAREIDEFRTLQLIQQPIDKVLASPLAVDSILSDDDCLTWLRQHFVKAGPQKGELGGTFHFTVLIDWETAPISVYATEKYAAQVRNAFSKQGVQAQVDALIEIPAVRSRLIGEARRRLEPVQSRRREALERVAQREEERASDSNFLQDLLSGR